MATTITKKNAPARRITKPASGERYDVHPSVAMMQKWVAELPQETGRSLPQWIAFVKKEGPADEKGRREWLKSEHGMGTNSAWWIAEQSMGSKTLIADEDPQEYLRGAAKWIEEMYSGGKAGLRPLHDALIRFGRSLGKDVKVCPCQTIVPLYRNHVFAQIKPSTRTRIDFGLCFKDYDGPKLPKRLIDTGGAKKGDRITHRFEITSLEDIDDEVKKWTKAAYALDA